MPNVNLTDSRQRDAVVKAESTGVVEELRYVDNQGKSAYTRKILKATVAHDYATLVQQYDNDKDKLARAIVEGDPEIDLEKCGLYLWGVSKVYVDSDDGIVYRIEQTEVVRDPNGNVKEKRPRQRSEANVDMEIPLTWTGRKIDKAEAIRRFVFSSKLQIVHINGLTYDFLFGIATELAESNSMMMLGAGSKGRDPLIFRSGSIPYRGFLEGRVEGDKYILLLHLSNMELKQFAESDENTDTRTDDSKEAKQNKPAADKTEAVEMEKPDVQDTLTEADVVNEGQKHTVDIKPGVQDSKKKVEETADTKGKTTSIVDSAETERKPAKKKKSKAKKSNEKTHKNKKEKHQSSESTADKESPAAAVDKKDKINQAATDRSRAAEGAISSQDLGVWLKSIRMGKYLGLFVENEIDVDVLSELTDEDLKELEIPLGSRRRLLKAVAEADNLRAEVAMAVQTMSATKAPTGK